ncbi:MAG: hypothetical protein HOY69_21340 [Streptomyces sp.]|nr:hypothetical protein [Streptomyces sp.]
MNIPGFTGERSTCRPHAAGYRRAEVRGVDYGACQDECREESRRQCQNSYDPQACAARVYKSCMKECTYEPYCYDVTKHDPDGSVWRRTVCKQYDGSLDPQTPWCRTTQRCDAGAGILLERTECQRDDGSIQATPWSAVDIC